MASRRPNCGARQYSDQMMCDRCTLVWDMNDPEPPDCENFVVPVEFEKQQDSASKGPRYSASAEAVKHLRGRKAYKGSGNFGWDWTTHPDPESGLPTGTVVTAERKLETAKLPVTELDGPLLEMAFYGALKKAGIPGFAYRNMNSFLELDVVIEDYEAPADPPLAGQYVAARFGVIRCHGGSPFIAAARCFVKSVYGPEITVQMAG